MAIRMDKNISTKRIPAAALTSRSFKTGILYPSTFSPKPNTLLITVFLIDLRQNLGDFS
jgi:hypothetical protein